MMKVHSIRYNFIMNFLLTASNFIFPLITFPYVARVLGASGNGKVAFVASVANYFALVASLGIPTYGIRACAQARDDRNQLSKTVHELLTINSITTLIVIATYVVAVMTIPKFAEEHVLFTINGVNIVLNLFGMNWLYQALEQYDYITTRSVLFKIISILLMFLLVHSSDDYVIYGAISVFAAAGSNVFNIVRSRKLISYHHLSDYNLKRHVRPIVLLSAQTLAVSIYANLDIVMLGFFRDATDVGYYNASMRVKSLLLSLVASLANVLLPRMSYYVKEGLHDEFLSLMGQALRFTTMLSAPLCVYFFCFAKYALLLLAGSEYLEAVPTLQAIVLAVLPNGLTGVLGIQVLVPLERESNLLVSVIIGAVCDFSLNLILIPLCGAFGAAIATTIAEISVFAVQAWYCNDLLSSVQWKMASMRYVLAAVLSCIPSVALTYVIQDNPLISLTVSTFLFGIVYSLSLLLLKDPDFSSYARIIAGKLSGKRQNTQ